MKNRRTTYFYAGGTAAIVVGVLALAWFIGPRALIYGAVAALLLFLIYALRNIPRRHGRHGVGQIEQAVDHRSGVLHRSHREDPIREKDTPKVRRNDPCPCGSGEKYKRCCGIG